MRAAETFLILSRSTVWTADDRLVTTDSPDLYGTVRHRSFRRWVWEVTVGEYGRVLVSGEARSRGGAKVAAICAGHRPGLPEAVMR